MGGKVWLQQKATLKGVNLVLIVMLRSQSIFKPENEMGHVSPPETHRRKCSTSWATREMQTLRFHLTPFRMAVIKKTVTVNTGREVNKREGLCIPDGNVNFMEVRTEISQNNIWPSYTTPGVYPKDSKKREILSHQCLLRHYL